MGFGAARSASLGGSKMKRPFSGAVVAVSAVAALGLLVNAGTLRADDKDKDFGKGKPGETTPPQTLPQGFESHRELAADATPSKHAAQYSACIVDSSRFMAVPHRSCQPDRGDPPVVNLPVNIGIIKAKNGDITLYDTGWKQKSYIYDWNGGWCYPPRLPQLMKNWSGSKPPRCQASAQGPPGPNPPQRGVPV